jgi:Protein of unknown function (DUF2793)
MPIDQNGNSPSESSLMSDATTHLLLPYILAAQAQKHVTHNEALRLLDGLVQLSVRDRDRTTPPGAPADGDRHIVGSGATGLWAGWDGNVAYWVDGAWTRLVSRAGWQAWAEDEGLLLVFDGTAWISAGAPTTLQNLERLGLGTTADATNPGSMRRSGQRARRPKAAAATCALSPTRSSRAIRAASCSRPAGAGAPSSD